MVASPSGSGRSIPCFAVSRIVASSPVGGRRKPANAAAVSIVLPPRGGASWNGSAPPGRNSATPSTRSCGIAMPDWTTFVRERLQLRNIRPEYEQDVVADLASQLEDAYRDAIDQG